MARGRVGQSRHPAGAVYLAAMNRHPPSRLFVALLSSLVAVLPGAILARPLVIDDLYAWRDVAEPRISADGRWVAYTLTMTDRERDADDSDVWMTSWDGRRQIRLTSSPGAEHHARWSADGRYLAFLSDREDPGGGDQVWRLDLRGGEAERLTEVPGGVRDFAWSPDSQRLVLVAETDPQARDPEAPAPIVLDRLDFKLDEVGYLTSARSHLFLFDIAARTLTQLTDGPYDEWAPAWSPDGSALAFVSKRGPDPDATSNTDIYVMEARAGAAIRQVTRNPGSDGEGAQDSGFGGVPPDWSPEGARLAYLHGGAPEDLWYGLVQIGLISANGEGEPALPTRAADRNAYQPRWSADGRAVFFLLEDDRSVQLARVRTRGGSIERLTPPGSTVYAYDIGPDNRVAVLLTRSDRPAELWALERRRLRQLTHHNDQWLREVELARAEEIAFRSADGEEVRGLLMKPPGYRGGARLPALLSLHGGPVSQFQHEFDFEWQLLAAQGYAIIGPNPRGSPGRGFAFQRMLFANWGFADVPDVLAAVEHAVAAGVADPQRLGVGGWSYGGILTNYVIASDGRFRAAVSGAGMSNMLGGYGIDQYIREWELELGLPWENTELWLRLSYPFLHADRIHTPTLFMCGELDFNVPLAASEQMYAALRRLGVPTRLVIYPGEFHSFALPSFRYDALARSVAWYDRYVKAPPETPARAAGPR